MIDCCFIFRKLITRELQEWHQQQVSKYKSLPKENSQTTTERIPTPVSQIEENESMIASILPSLSEDSRTICSSSFLMTEEPITLPAIIATSLSINNENPIDQEKSRLDLLIVFFLFRINLRSRK